MNNYGNKIMTTQGEKINIEGNAVKSTSYDSDGSVITGYELSSTLMAKRYKAVEIPAYLSKMD